MKKRILCAALAATMALSSLFGLVACKDKTPSGNNPGPVNPGGTLGGAGTIEPGTVVTDEAEKSTFYDALTGKALEGLSFTGSATLRTEGEQTTEMTILAEGAFKSTPFAADAFLTLSSAAEDEEGQYALFFVRGDASYSVSGDLEKGETLSSVKNSLKAAEDPLILEKETIERSPAAEALLKSKGLIKIIKNVPPILGGIITKTEGGYTLSYDFISIADAVLTKAVTIAGTFDREPETTVLELFKHQEIAGLLQKVLNGVTAVELKEAVSPLLPQEISAKLPAAEDGITAVKYLENVLASETLYAAAVGEAEGWSEWKTFGEIPVLRLTEMFSAAREKTQFSDTVTEFKNSYKKLAVSFLGEFLGMEGEVSGEKLALSLTFSFDDEKNLLGMTLEASASGTFAAASEAELSEVATQGQKASASLKLEATKKSAPELFDLSGCKYRGDEGAVTIK